MSRRSYHLSRRKAHQQTEYLARLFERAEQDLDQQKPSPATEPRPADSQEATASKES